MTTDRISGSALALFALGVIWESRHLPLGTVRVPGPAFAPVLLASLLLIFGVLIAATGGRAEHLRSLRWRELPHAVAILAVCVFAALALERLGYRLTVFLVLVFLVKVIEKEGWLLAAVFALAV